MEFYFKKIVKWNLHTNKRNWAIFKCEYLLKELKDCYLIKETHYRKQIYHFFKTLLYIIIQIPFKYPFFE